MSNDIQKADQIAFHFYTKLFYAVNDARATEGPKVPSKVDKWFNLETPDSDLFTKEAREPYRNISQSPSSRPAPFEIQVLLSVPELANNQGLVYLSPDSSRVRIEPTPKYIVLETWTLECAPHQAGYNEQFNNNADIALPIIYKHGIVLFRSVYSMLRILPVWKFYKRLRRKTAGVNRNGNFGIQLRTRPLSVDGSQSEILEFNRSPSPIHQQPFPTASYTFPPIPHILGIFTLSTTYLETPNFQLDELESLLSSRFISLDREEFVPTLEKNRQRDSISGSSLPSSSKSTTSRSPPMQIARATSAGGGGVDSITVAERFILPSSIGTSASTGNSALIPPPRPFPSMTTGTTNIGVTTSSSGLALNRIRKESMNSSSSSLVSMRDNIAGTSSPVSSSPSSGPVPIRKPSIFKSNTVSSASGSSPSLSIRQGPSSLTRESGGVPAPFPSAGGGTHSRQPSYHSPLPTVARLPPSPIGSGFSGGSPSHNFGSPSSQGDRRPGTSGSGASIDRDRRTSMNSIGFGTSTAAEEGVHDTGSLPSRKRYSSSFGHRYTASGSSSTGTGAVIVGPAPNGGVVSHVPSSVGGHQAGGGYRSSSTPASPIRGSTPVSAGTEGLASYLSTATDDDDISVFVQDIDSRKPLSGRRKQLVKSGDVQEAGTSLQEPGHDRESSDTTVRSKRKEASSATSHELHRNRFADAPVTTSPLERAWSVPNETEQETVEGSTHSSTSPPRGLMLTSQGEVDERLSKMKEVFLKSIEGLGSGNGSSRRKEKERTSPTMTATASGPSSKASYTATPFERELTSNSSSRSGSSSSVDRFASRGMTIGFPSQGSDVPSSRGSPYAYSAAGLGMGIGRARYASTSSSTLANSDVGASQGSEEVIGRMDLYEDRRRGGYQG